MTVLSGIKKLFNRTVGGGIRIPDRFRKVTYLQHIIENISQSIIIIDRHGFIQFVNNSFCQSWGFLPPDVIGQHFTMLVPLELHPQEIDLFKEILTGITVKDHPAEARTKDGRSKHVLISGSLAEMGNGRYSVILITDIDDLINTKNRLIKSEQELTEIYDTSNAVAWEASASTRAFRKISARITQLCGFTTEEWQTPGFIDSVTLSINGDPKADFFSFLKSSTSPITLELQINTRIYGQKWLRFDANERNNGPKYLFSGFIFDITDVKNTELENQRLLEKMRETNAMKDDFLAQVSHELRTPISIILGWIDLLGKGKVDASKTSDAYDYIEKNARLQINLIDDLLDLARIEKGTLHSKIELVDITDCLRSTIGSLQIALQSKKLKLSTRIPKRRIDVIGDPERLAQIFWNIFTNSIKFTPQDGAILIDLEVHLDKVEIRIEDTGRGIDPEFLPHVFEKFTREADLMKRQSGGLGLGLSIVKTLTETHGGTIVVESDGENKGTCVILRFPFISRHDTEIAGIPILVQEEPAQELDFLQGLRILVVDDVSDVTDILKEMLVSKGAVVHSCTNAADAYQAVIDFRPNILISDIAMPGQSGVDLIHRIRSLSSDRGGNLPAAALTAFVKSTTEKHLLAAGFNKVLSKPVRSAELYSSLKALKNLESSSVTN